MRQGHLYTRSLDVRLIRVGVQRRKWFVSKHYIRLVKSLHERDSIQFYAFSFPILALPPPLASARSCVPTTSPVLLLLNTPETEYSPMKGS